MTHIKYIGHRDPYREGAYGSGLVFAKGETKNIEDDLLAKKLLRHPDVYVLAAAEEAVDAKTESQGKTEGKQDDEDKENESQDARDAIAQMSKDALADYAKIHFKVDLDMRKSVGNLRTEVTGLYDQFGVE